MENESILYNNNSHQKKITKTIVLYGLNGVGKYMIYFSLKRKYQ